MNVENTTSATTKEVQKNISKAAISEYKHCKSVHLKEGELLSFIFTFYADNLASHNKLINALKQYGCNCVWNSVLHSKSEAFVVYGSIGLKLNLKSFINTSSQLFQLANEIGANYLFFEIGEIQEYYDLGLYMEDMGLELEEAFEDSEEEENEDLPF